MQEEPGLYKLFIDDKTSAAFSGDETQMSSFLSQHEQYISRGTIYGADDETLSEPMSAAEWMSEIMDEKANVKETPQRLLPGYTRAQILEELRRRNRAKRDAGQRIADHQKLVSKQKRKAKNRAKRRSH